MTVGVRFPRSRFASPALRDAIHPRHQATFRVFDPLDFLAEVSAHFPDAHEKTTLFYGWYSNRTWGYWKWHGVVEDVSPADPAADESNGAPLEVHRSWARLLRQVYKVDPLVCPRCGRTMRVIAVIERPAVVRQILTHLWFGTLFPQWTDAISAPYEGAHVGGDPSPARSPWRLPRASPVPAHAGGHGTRSLADRAAPVGAKGGLASPVGRLRVAMKAVRKIPLSQQRITDFLDAVGTGRQPLSSGRDNLKTLSLVFAAYRSAEERRQIQPSEIL